ncbi:MAG: HAMP domain-containing protein [Thermoleophilia bacterium]|nr:HAMP domain-containing protein [Thermoleophilia bacterium]
MSLRLRLLFGILALSAVGLLTLDVVSYRVLEDHLGDRTDQQVESASRPLAAVLRDKAGLDSGLFGGGNAGGDELPPPVAGIGEPGPSGGATGGGQRDGPPEELPPGTYGQLRSPEGKVLATVSFDYGDDGASRPDLSGDIPVSRFNEPPQQFTVDAKEGDGQFRAAATSGPDALVTIAAVPLNDNEETLEKLALIEAIVTASVLIAIALLGWFVIGIGLRPLRRMGETADEIARGDLSRRVEDTNPKTEVGRLGIALNAMLGQIEESFQKRKESEEKMRRFLADASHELRTPLASIRGYSELFRLGAMADPEETTRAMTRIETESQRMGELVDDLLALARLDEMPERKKELVMLGPLIEESVGDFRVTSSDREFTFEPGGDLRLNGDADQLRRAINNLLRNAVVHTPAGSPIDVTAVREDGEIAVVIRDHGDGLPPGAEDAVFDRFWRDSKSRSRDGGGAGIGLAIVAAVAESHGGSAVAGNAPEGGAAFTLRLPAAP